MLPLDPFGDVLGGRVRNLVPEHRGESRVVPGHREDARVHHDLPAGQAVRVRLVLVSAHSLDAILSDLNKDSKEEDARELTAA